MNPALGKWTHLKQFGTVDTGLFDFRTYEVGEGEGEAVVDPLERLLDPEFTDTTWDYPESRIGPTLPGKLHQKQVEALDWDTRHGFTFWGNQSGKTTLGAVSTDLLALGRHPLQERGLMPMPPITAWASALSWELWEKILLPELLTWLPRLRVLDAPRAFMHSTKRDILVRADNGTVSRITGKAAEQGADKYQAARVHWVWMDEEHPESVWNEVQPRLLRFNGRTLATLTPLKGQATYLYHRIYLPAKDGREPPERYRYSHAGVADNPGITESAIDEITSELSHSPSQLEARLHGKFVKPEGIVYQFELERHGVTLEGEALRTFVAKTPLYGMFDLGKWRFFFAWGGADREEGFTVIDEVFSQNETSDVRALAIHTQLTQYKVRDLSIIGECADPEELREMNEAFARIDSPFRFWPVDAEKKNRQKGVTRVESLLHRVAFHVRRTMGAGHTWRLGRSAASAGSPMEGSRMIWEFGNWAYPVMPDGKVQKDDPDDATADGADAMDALRYLMLTVYGFVEEPAAMVPNPTLLQRLQQEMREIDEEAKGEGAERRYGSVLRQ